VQGDKGRTELLDQFRKSGNGVLIGSQSFWEGVDVRGEALSLVIIDKLPFAPPDDPVLAARIEVMEKQGKNGFMHHTLPEAIINLKQGAGRLIRDEGDRGVLMLCDPRVISKPYGRRIWQSLPPFKRTREEAEVLEFFRKAAAGRGRKCRSQRFRFVTSGRFFVPEGGRRRRWVTTKNGAPTAMLAPRCHVGARSACDILAMRSRRGGGRRQARFKPAAGSPPCR